MPTINWEVEAVVTTGADHLDRTTSDGDHLLKQIAGMFSVAHRLIEDLSKSVDFSLNPEASSEIELFLRNFRHGLLARLSRCGDGLRQIQKRHSLSKSFSLYLFLESICVN